VPASRSTVPRAHTRSVPGAAVADGGGRFRVVVFSPGLGGVRTQRTAWAEELASRGYVVVALDHPYDSAAVVLADGRTIHTKVAATGDPDNDEKLVAGWTRVRAADLSVHHPDSDR
jgi:alpha-beta hydrolase superfamily lysophospholipase